MTDNGAVFGTYLTEASKVLLQLPVRYKDDPFLAAFAVYEDLAAVRRNVADF
ncbi:hypothetical protein [uncultured Tateyamaria sp.]|uniref:hypothetical protein n=1 Tax=uncultured Tateyamaria sp. TaxID=455651 RepID=UPI00262282E0|nr:hypothetical protein [uncultured Tateyamaria sp.]